MSLRPDHPMHFSRPVPGPLPVCPSAQSFPFHVHSPQIHLCIHSPHTELVSLPVFLLCWRHLDFEVQKKKDPKTNPGRGDGITSGETSLDSLALTCPCPRGLAAPRAELQAAIPVGFSSEIWTLPASMFCREAGPPLICSWAVPWPWF